MRGTPMFMRDPWGSFSPTASDLVVKMLEKDPKQRVTAAAAASHSWFVDVLGSEAGGGSAAGEAGARAEAEAEAAPPVAC